MENMDNVVLVQCPECGTVGNFHRDKVGVNPKRVKCPECGETLNLARRSSIPPQGLKNFEYIPLPPEREQNLSDFGILRESYGAIPDNSLPSTTPPPMLVEQENTPLKTFREYFDENDASWQEEKPSKLLSSTIGQLTTFTRAAGKFAVVVILVAVVMLVYIAYRNNWSLSTEGFHGQLNVALSGERPVKQPPAAKQIAVTVDERQTLFTKDGKLLLVVHGEVFNDGLTSRKNIKLRGRLVDRRGNVYAETIAPCGKTESYDDIMSSEKDALAQRYMSKAKFFNCQIKPHAIDRYQLIFDVVPDPVIETDVDVKVVSASYP